jgi:WD40 repeat protein
VKTFKGDSNWITCIDISADNTRLASGSWDKTARIWNLDAGKLVAGPFKSEDGVGTVRFSPDSKKLAVKSQSGRCLEVWDIQSQKLDVKVGEYRRSGTLTYSPIFWTNKNENIIAAFSFTEDVPAKKIYEFNASTLEAVGAPFEGHTRVITSLALSFDYALLASASFDDTIKLWAFESRQLLASFDVQKILRLVFSPDSRQLAYTIHNRDNEYNICICDTPPKVLAQARVRFSPNMYCTVRVLTFYYRILHAQSQTSIIYSMCASHSLITPLKYSPIAITTVSCNSSFSCRIPRTTDIRYSYSAETSAYKRSAATCFPSPRRTLSLPSRERGPCSSHPISWSPRCML